jgi:pyruvate dehydrogenase E1 component
MPDNVESEVLRGIYRFRPAEGAQVRLFGSGSIMQQVLRAAELLAESRVTAEVWSVTSYTELYRDAISCEQYNRAHPGGARRTPYVTEALGESGIPIVAASDYMKVLATSIAQWLPGPLVALGTDGFGISESRPELRRHFEVDASSIARAALDVLQLHGSLIQTARFSAVATAVADATEDNP